MALSRRFSGIGSSVFERLVMAVQLSIGARVRKSPFFQASCKAGLAAASVYNHMYMPTSYGDPAAEYDRLINGVACGMLRLSGRLR